MTPTPARTRLKQLGVVLLGLVVAVVMVVLGLWQLDVYSRSGARAADARAAEPAVALIDVARPGQAVQDGYGRTVTTTGRWDPRLQVLVPDVENTGRSRVLTGLRLAGGGVLPVVRGTVDATTGTGPTPPTGTVTVAGVLLGSEPDPGTGAPTTSTALPAVELPVLAQRWTVTLVNGYVTLDAAAASAEGLRPAQAVLPDGQGRSRNAAYALQWWIFAAFALGLGSRMARDIGRGDDYEFALLEGEGEARDDAETPENEAEHPANEPEKTTETVEVGLSRRA